MKRSLCSICGCATCTRTMISTHQLGRQRFSASHKLTNQTTFAVALHADLC